MSESFCRVDRQPDLLDKPRFLAGIVDNDVGVKITCRIDETQEIVIEFHEVIAYRSVLEEMQADFWASFHETKSAPGSVFLVGNSEWLGSFSDFDLIHYKDAKHYLVIVDQRRLDILSCKEPGFAVVRFE